jgi:sodium pump decarboxylase, gamma subunit
VITTEYISFGTSFLSSLLGLGIVFLSLVFLAIFVMIVSKVISALEKNLAVQAPTPQVASAPTAGAVQAAAGSEAVKVAVIAAAISEERREPVNSFVITNIKKI